MVSSSYTLNHTAPQQPTENPTTSRLGALFKRFTNCLVKPETILTGVGLITAAVGVAVAVAVSVPLAIPLIAIGAGLVIIGCVISALSRYSSSSTLRTSEPAATGISLSRFTSPQSDLPPPYVNNLPPPPPYTDSSPALYPNGPPPPYTSVAPLPSSEPPPYQEQSPPD